ncbi:MAG: acylphosphatase [Dehalococcoidales bacterium]
MTEMVSLHATIQGRVQGVFFRASVEERALQLSLTGYVRNKPGNLVEVRAEGEMPNLEKLLEFLKVGPPGANVKDIIPTWGEYTGSFPAFRIR